MWDRSSAWFDLSLVLAIFAIGGAIFGRFEMHKPRWRRVLKIVGVSALYVALAQGLGREWAYGFLGVMTIAVVVIHAWWLPSHGINGVTAEPYDRYLALVNRRR